MHPTHTITSEQISAVFESTNDGTVDRRRLRKRIAQLAPTRRFCARQWRWRAASRTGNHQIGQTAPSIDGPRVERRKEAVNGRRQRAHGDIGNVGDADARVGVARNHIDKPRKHRITAMLQLSCNVNSMQNIGIRCVLIRHDAVEGTVRQCEQVCMQ